MNEILLMQILIPVLIFLARVTDVSIGTLRIIFVSRGIRTIAAMCGFFEILIWLLAISQIMHNLNNFVNYVAYAAGFGMGNFVGISIERKILLGNLLIRVITKKEAGSLIKALSSHGYGVTSVDGEGSKGPVKIIFSVIKRKELNAIVSIIRELNPQAFYTIEDMRFASERNLFPLANPSYRGFFGRFQGSFQKRK